MYALQQDSAVLEDCVVCGTRGWLIPTEDSPLSAEDRKIYERELARLDLALQSAKERGGGWKLSVCVCRVSGSVNSFKTQTASSDDI
jgi:predicted phosphohydrolase